VGDGGLVLHSADLGATWQTVDAGTTETLYSVASAQGSVWIGGAQGVRRSVDGGATWLSLTVPGAIDTLALWVSDDGTRLFAGGSLGAVAVSADGGDSWTPVLISADLSPTIWEIWGAPDASAVFFAGFHGDTQPVILRYDAGGPAVLEYEGAPRTNNVTGLAGGRDGAPFYATGVAAPGHALLRREGTTWTPVAGVPQPDTSVEHLSVGAGGRVWLGVGSRITVGAPGGSWTNVTGVVLSVTALWANPAGEMALVGGSSADADTVGTVPLTESPTRSVVLKDQTTLVDWLSALPPTESHDGTMIPPSNSIPILTGPDVAPVDAVAAFSEPFLRTQRSGHDIPLPESFQWGVGDEAGVPVSAVRQQGKCGSCWAHATAQALSDNFVCRRPVTGSSREPYNPEISATAIIARYPFASFAGFGPTHGCDGGAVEFGLRGARADGVPSQCCVDYSWCTQLGTSCEVGSEFQAQTWSQTHPGVPSDGCYAEGGHAVFRPGTFGSDAFGYDGITRPVGDVVNNDVLEFRERVKRHIYTFGPVVGNYFVLRDFVYGPVSGIYVETPGSQDMGGHSVTIVGWGTGNVAGIGAVPYWICRNSWGEGWGDGGYWKHAMYPVNKRSQFTYKDVNGNNTYWHIIKLVNGTRGEQALGATTMSLPPGKTTADFIENQPAVCPARQTLVLGEGATTTSTTSTTTQAPAQTTTTTTTTTQPPAQTTTTTTQPPPQEPEEASLPPWVIPAAAGAAGIIFISLGILLAVRLTNRAREAQQRAMFAALTQ
jgi:hypothetical protein